MGRTWKACVVAAGGAELRATAADAEAGAGLRPVTAMSWTLAVGPLRRREEMRGPKARPGEGHEQEKQDADTDGERCEDGTAPIVVIPEVAGEECM